MPDNDPSVRNSPAWWMSRLTDRLSKKLRDDVENEKPGLNTLNDWLENKPPLPEAAPSWLPAYQSFHSTTRTNYASLPVTSAADRMTPTGFRTAATDDRNGDALAHRVWSENHMPMQQADLIHDMLGLREGFIMVGPPATGSAIPVMTVEDPRQVQVAQDPLRPWVNRAAIKTYHDPDEDEDVCVVYLPGETPSDRAVAYTARKPSKRGVSVGNARFRYRDKMWSWDEPEELQTWRVPIARLGNRRGLCEFEPHIPNLDRLNRMTLHRMLIGELQSFRQRAVKGLPDVYPDTYPVPEMRGKPIDYEGVFTPGPGSLWQVPDGVDFWESEPGDVMRPLLEQERMEARTYAALARIPISYLNPDDANGSAEGASLQREGLIYRVEDRLTIASAGLAQAMSLAFETMGDQTRADVSQIETIWAPIERLSLGERYSAASQAVAAGLSPQTVRREVLHFSPQQLEQASEDDALARILAPRPPQRPLEVRAERVDRTQPGQPAIEQPRA